MKQEQEKQGFWKDGLSISETKFSMLVIAFMIGYGVLMYLCVRNNDISTVEHVVVIIISAITGINITQAVSSKKQEPPKG